MSDSKITYQDIANAIGYFRKYGISADDIKRQITPEKAQDILNTITEKDFSYGSGKKTPGTTGSDQNECP